VNHLLRVAERGVGDPERREELIAGRDAAPVALFDNHRRNACGHDQSGGESERQATLPPEDRGAPFPGSSLHHLALEIDGRGLALERFPELIFHVHEHAS
jgi:hypothetical protein